jgi:putative ABC transport system substrate-binding protein
VLGARRKRFTRAAGAVAQSYFPIQYSISICGSLKPVLMSKVLLDSNAPFMPTNFPVPPVSLDRPGGNATGFNFFTLELVAKRMQLLRELVPAAKRIGLLTNPTDPINESALRDVEAAAVGQQILVFEATTGREIDAAFESLTREVEALFVTGGGFFDARRVQLAVLAARYGIPTTYSVRHFVEAGGLMSYGTNYADMCRQVGIYAARILKGAKPMDLPVMQATRFELVINLNTARALRLDVPTTLLAIADKVIEQVRQEKLVQSSEATAGSHGPQVAS